MWRAEIFRGAARELARRFNHGRDACRRECGRRGQGQSLLDASRMEAVCHDGSSVGLWDTSHRLVPFPFHRHLRPAQARYYTWRGRRLLVWWGGGSVETDPRFQPIREEIGWKGMSLVCPGAHLGIRNLGEWRFKLYNRGILGWGFL